MPIPPGHRIQPIDLPFLDKEAAKGRIVPLMSFFDDEEGEWNTFIQENDGRLLRLAGGEVVMGTYLARQAAEATKDLELPFYTVVLQHLSLKRTMGPLEQLVADIHHFSSILEKYERLSQPTSHKSDGVSQLFRSEIEYLLMLVRSFYDLVQKLAKQLGRTIRRIDAPEKNLMTSLPDSFAKVVLQGDRLRSQPEIETKYGMTPALAHFYADEAPLFLTLRKVRVSIEHHGFTPSWVLQLEEGLAVPVDMDPWTEFSIWEPSHIRNNRLGSLRRLFLYLVQTTLRLPDRFIAALTANVGVQPPLAPGCNVYLRDPFSKHLVNLDESLATPWEAPPKID